MFPSLLPFRHSVLLKNLKPLPQGSPMGSWNTVSGKKMKRPILHAQNVLAGRIHAPPLLNFAILIVNLPVINKGKMCFTDADCRGSKNPNKPTKSPSVLPPRLQGVKQHHLPGPGMHSQQTSPECKAVVKNPLQAVR